MENSYLKDYSLCNLDDQARNLSTRDNHRFQSRTTSFFAPCEYDSLNSEFFFNEPVSSETRADLNVKKPSDQIEIDEQILDKQTLKPLTRKLNENESSKASEFSSTSATTPNNTNNIIEIESVKNKLSSFWNNVKYGWASYIKKPSKISLEKSGPIFILGKKFNPNNPYERPIIMNHFSQINGDTTALNYDLVDASLNESFINPSIPIFDTRFSINNTDYLSSGSSASLSTSPFNQTNKSYYLVDDKKAKKKDYYLQPDANSELKTYLEKELHSRLWFTYRKDFQPINGNLKYTSDCGWGCMLRSAQMLIAQAFLLHFFGREWTLYRKFNPNEFNLYKQIISWFNDRPSKYCPFGIHRLLEIADQKLIGSPNGTDLNRSTNNIGSRVGSWFGPNSVCLLMKEALNESIESNPVLEQIKLYVAQDCTIYKQDLIEMCLEKTTNTFKPCIILVSVRLGGEDLNDIYVSSLKRFLEMDICVGIIGGKPKHSLYFMGYQGDKVIYLDPHFCQPTTNIYSHNDPSLVVGSSSPASSLSSSKHSYDDNLSDYEVFENASYHCENPSKTPFSKLDPSLAIGFYCATLRDVDNLCEYVKKTPSLDNMFPIFGVSEESFEKMHSNFQVLNLDDQQQTHKSPSSSRKPSTSRSRNVSVTSESSRSHAKTKSKVSSPLQMKATKSKNSFLSSSSSSKSKRKQSSVDQDDFVLV